MTQVPGPQAAARRTALITGASAGLGAEFARQLAAADHDLVLVARRVKQLDTLARALRARHGITVRTIAADLSDRQAPEQLAETLRAEAVHVDVLVNNAGASGPNLLEKPGFEQHADYLELMAVSVAHLCHLFVPAMRERGYGRVINVASVAGRILRPGDHSYGPTKAYLVALSEGMNGELEHEGVHVCALCPGFTHTDFHAVADKLAMKERMPSVLWYDADVVVREGLAAVEAGKPVYVSGRLYRWLDPLFQSVLTRRLFSLSAFR